MPKGALNPADAYRKAQRKKELKKNKAERSKARDLALVKKDTSELEQEIGQLESSNGDKARLAELKAELEKISKKKEEYVNEHPEQRGLVYRKRRKHNDDEPKAESPIVQRRNLFNKKGLPRHPERSIYYDPIMNPYGVPPPGMPYMERPLRPDEVDSDADDDNDDIPMPTGLPPGSELVDSEDEIFLPEGPPPTKMKDALLEPTSLPLSNVTLPPLPPPSGLPFGNIPLPLPPGIPPGVALLPPPLPPPPPGFPPSLIFPASLPPGVPFNSGIPYPPLPPPPPGFFPRHQSASSMQDPLSSIPHVTYQAHRAGPPRSSLPHNPSLPPKPTAAAELANATVIAAPQLRDFKKEATAFVPTSLKRKKPTSSITLGTKINAAPPLAPATPMDETEPDESRQAPDRLDLVSMLKNQFGPITPGPLAGAKQVEGRKSDDYAKFVEEMSDILGPQP